MSTAISAPPRRPRGRPFVKGHSGNPAGRPPVVAIVRDLARQYTPQAIQTLAVVMSDPKASPATKVTAAAVLLERGYGRPANPGAAA